MRCFTLVCEFLTGLIVFFAIGWLIARVTRIDKYLNPTDDDDR